MCRWRWTPVHRCIYCNTAWKGRTEIFLKLVPFGKVSLGSVDREFGTFASAAQWTSALRDHIGILANQHANSAKRRSYYVLGHLFFHLFECKSFFALPSLCFKHSQASTKLRQQTREQRPKMVLSTPHLLQIFSIPFET